MRRSAVSVSCSRHTGGVRAVKPSSDGASGDAAGISLFEVVLSLVILVSTLAAIGQLISGGGRGAVRSRLLRRECFWPNR